MKSPNLIIILFLFLFFPIIGVCSHPTFTNAGTISDNFDGPSINKRLWWVPPYHTDQNQRCFQQDGVLKIQIDGASTGDVWFGAGINSCFDLKGNFEIVVDYNLTNWPTANGVRANLMYSDPENHSNSKNGNINRCSFGADEPPNPKESYAVAFMDDFFLDVKILPTTDNQGKMKLTRVGNVMTGYFWQNNAWQLIGSHDYSATGLADWLMIGLSAVSSTVSRLPDGKVVHPFAGKNVEVVFDNLQITYDQIRYFSQGGPAPGSIMLLLD